MADTRLTLYCASADASTIAEALKNASGRPVHVRAEQVYGLDFGDAGTREMVTGKLNRAAVELIIDAQMIASLIDIVTKVKRCAPVRWHSMTIEAEGRII